MFIAIFSGHFSDLLGNEQAAAQVLGSSRGRPQEAGALYCTPSFGGRRRLLHAMLGKLYGDAQIDLRHDRVEARIAGVLAQAFGSDFQPCQRRRV